MDDFKLLVDFHLKAERQGPGGKQQTLQALELACLDDSKKLKAADIGCGSGASTLVLAKNLNADITAVDLFPEFLDMLNSQLSQIDCTGRVTTKALSMDSLPFSPGELDLIWSEGAIYNIGFKKGVNDWKPFLKQGGVLATSEITWLTSKRPKEIEEHWNNEYPEIGTASQKIKVLEEAGYKLLGYFPLPTSCWLDNYYDPIETRMNSFLEKHDNSEAAADIVDGEKREIELFKKYGEYYSYGFYIAEKL